MALGKTYGLIHHTALGAMGMGTNQLLVTSSYPQVTQVSTQQKTSFNSLGSIFLPTIHRTNSKGNKVNTL
jgi:hypothetical protein